MDENAMKVNQAAKNITTTRQQVFQHLQSRYRDEPHAPVFFQITENLFNSHQFAYQSPSHEPNTFTLKPCLVSGPPFLQWKKAATLKIQFPYPGDSKHFAAQAKALYKDVDSEGYFTFDEHVDIAGLAAMVKQIYQASSLFAFVNFEPDDLAGYIETQYEQLYKYVPPSDDQYQYTWQALALIVRPGNIRDVFKLMRQCELRYRGEYDTINIEGVLDLLVDTCGCTYAELLQVIQQLLLAKHPSSDIAFLRQLERALI